jgi:uncharacterized small protein (DUF1192 family)
MADPSETTQVTSRPNLGQSSRDEPGGAELLVAVRELSARVGGLQSELRALRAQTQSLPTARSNPAGWEDRGAPRWVQSLDSPTTRRSRVPRLALEVVFLVGVAVACAIARLDARVIAGVMAGAWLLVALAEWTAARADKRRDQTAYVALSSTPPRVVPVDGSWFDPPIERTMLEPAEPDQDSAGESAERTMTKLPPPASE